MLARKLTAASARAVAPWWRAGGAPEPVAVYQPIGAASLANSYVNLVNPGTFDAAPGVAPTFDAATGWQGDGATNFLTTGVVVGSGGTVVIRLSGISVLFPNRYFSSFVGGEFGMQAVTTSAIFLNGGSVSVAGTYSANVFAIAGNAGYVDGVNVATIPAGAAPTGTIELFRRPDNTRYTNGIIAAIAIYSSTLDASQVAAVSAAMAAL